MAKSKSRRRAAASSSSVSLPMDLITDILFRLPVKSLLMFKSVSKPFYSLIQSPHFIKLHLNFSKLNPNPIFSSILSLDQNTAYEYIFRLNLIDALGKPIDMNLPFMHGRVCRLLGISNGLLCLMLGDEYSCDVIIFNPATGNFKKIPPFVPTSCCQDDSHYGFNSNENGFELIRIGCSPSSVKVSSFSSSSNIWEDVIVNSQLTVFFHQNFQRSLPVYKDGVFYWKGYHDGGLYALIFDVFNKVLDVSNKALDCVLVPFDFGFELIEFREQLVAINLFAIENNVWTLNENDKTWKMLKSIDVSDTIPEFATVLGCTGNGKLVLSDCVDSNPKVYLYDMDTDDTNSLSHLNVDGRNGVYLFTESLAAV